MLDDINFYGIFLILNFVISIAYIMKKSIKKQFSMQDNFYMILYIVLGIIVGGKYYTILNHSINKEISFLSAGLSSLGSLIGSMVMLYLYIWQFKKKTTEVFNIFIPVLPLMYGIGKIGCFLSGCCLGFKYSGTLSVTYNNESYFPIQLFEAIIFIIIFVYVNNLSKKQDKLIIGKCLITCGIFKFLLEFFRLREEFILSNNQIVCIFLILLGLLIIIKTNYIKMKQKKC